MTSNHPDVTGPDSILRASWLPVLLMLMLAAAFLIGGYSLSSQKYDQDLYHIQVIRQFEAQLPVPDLSNYGAATGPGYHLVYAVVGTVIGSDIETLRWFSTVFAALLIVVVAGFSTTRCSPRAAALITAPLAVSYYFLGSAVHLQTDNLAWLSAALVMGPLVFCRLSPWSLATSACFLFLAVLVRQNFIWLAGPIILAGLLCTPPAERALFPARIAGSGERSGWGRFVCSLLVVIPGLLLLLVFRSLWSGLVPPNFQYFHSVHVIWIALGFSLAVLGLYAPFFLLVLPRCLLLVRRNTGWLIFAGVIGACSALIPPSDFNSDLGRSGGIMWKLANAGPVIADRSLVLTFFAAIGAASMMLIFLAMIQSKQKRGGLVLLCGWFATTSTMFLNSQSFQRYYDFPCLLLLVWGIALSLHEEPAAESRASYGPPLLAVIFAVLFAVASI